MEILGEVSEPSGIVPRNPEEIVNNPCSNAMAEAGRAELARNVDDTGKPWAALEITAQLVWDAMEAKRVAEDTAMRADALAARQRANRPWPVRCAP